MKFSRFITLITCLALTGAVSDMTVVVKRGENATLSAKTPEMREINRVTLSRYENGTQVTIFRSCSVKEKLRGCTAIDDNRVHLQPGPESVSVIILGARATDSGTHILEVIGNNIRETFNLEFNESSGSQSTTISPPSEDNTVVVVVIVGVFFAVLIIIVVVTVCVCLYKKKKQKKPDFLNYTVDSEVADTQSSITGADELNTNASSEERCLVEKKPEDLNCTHPDAHNLINNNNQNPVIIIIP